jgi:hypothetical protein
MATAECLTVTRLMLLHTNMDSGAPVAKWENRPVCRAHRLRRGLDIAEWRNEKVKLTLRNRMTAQVYEVEARLKNREIEERE